MAENHPKIKNNFSLWWIMICSFKQQPSICRAIYSHYTTLVVWLWVKSREFIKNNIKKYPTLLPYRVINNYLWMMQDLAPAENISKSSCNLSTPVAYAWRMDGSHGWAIRVQFFSIFLFLCFFTNNEIKMSNIDP